ncbi:hypothetical protein AAVH_28498 [Aphelenchoides avenae]|nr:hypothetical protein AAVH_28498 [Aphelenchus avenae]
MTLHPAHWAILIDAIGNGAVRGLYFNGIDIMLDAKTFLLAVDCRVFRRFCFADVSFQTAATRTI